MKVFLTFLIIFSSIDCSYGQYYNKLVDADIGVTDIPINSAINGNVIYTAGRVPSNAYSLLSKFDEFGNITAQNQAEGLQLLAGVASNRIYCLGDTVLILSRTQGTPLNLFNSDLDSLDRKEYILPEIDIEHYYHPGYMLHNESNLYLVGVINYFNHPLDKRAEGLIIRLNRPNLELDAVFIYPSDATDILFYHPKFDKDGNLSVGYEKFNFNMNDDRYGMLKFDNDFNLIQEVELPFHYQHGLTGENYELENGNFIFADEGRDSISAIWGSRAALHCMTPEGEEVWRRDELNLTGVGVTRPIEDYETARFNADGNLVFASIFHDGSSPFEACLMCIEPITGEVVWLRYFEAPDGVGTNNVRGTLKNLLQDDEGNLTLVGYRGTSDNGTNHWLIRTDSYGCIEPGCEVTHTDSEITKPEKLYTLLQNPINDNLTLSFSSNLIGLETQISLYNANGQSVHSENLVVQNELYQIPTSTFSNGMYFIEIKTENNVMQSGKVLVQH